MFRHEKKLTVCVQRMHTKIMAGEKLKESDPFFLLFINVTSIACEVRIVKFLI